MKKTQSKQVGLVLAGGASSRMGRPKPLLHLSDGTPLGRVQAELLRSAGCDPVNMVVGGAEEDVRRELGDTVSYVLNERWGRGRISSVQAGLRAAHPFVGCVLLPVDTAGVQADTIRWMLAAAVAGVLSVRPFYQGKRGLLCWISGVLYDPIMALDDASEKSARLDELLRPVEHRLDVEDAAVLNNINTPEAWAALCRGLEP